MDCVFGGRVVKSGYCNLGMAEDDKNGKKELTEIFDRNGVCWAVSGLGVKIKILKIGWKLISEIKHQEVRGKFSEVLETIKNPDTVLASSQSENIFLYHKRYNGRYLRVVCRHYGKEGFLITAHYIKKPKGGRNVKA